MSEYQYYEFQAIDKPLDRRAMQTLRNLTSRAEITPTSLINEYHWGDFRGNPDRLMDKYFDAHLYFANWGSRRFMLRLPRGLFDPATVKPYVVSGILNARTTKEHVILDFQSEDEGGEDFDEGEDWLADLIPLRSDLVAGDRRCLYLAWLAGVQCQEVDDADEQPPVPPGLGKLTGSLKQFADFLRVDEDLIATAATTSGSSRRSIGQRDGRMGGACPDADKNSILTRLLQGETAHLANELLLRLRQDRKRTVDRQASEVAAPAKPQTVADLRGSWEKRAEEERRRAAERTAAKAARQAREQAAARAQQLDALVGQETKLWRQVEESIATSKPKEYDRAVLFLKDLLDLGEHTGNREAVTERIRQVRKRYHGKRSLIQRLDRAGLPQ